MTVLHDRLRQLSGMVEAYEGIANRKPTGQQELDTAILEMKAMREAILSALMEAKRELNELQLNNRV
ncbi:hypothetical protein HYY74_05410 [Candidatus Woesearchaeota archaeon]|nr:hypothetical protein [Candidatus Woesearchaeota archaeon]